MKLFFVVALFLVATACNSKRPGDTVPKETNQPKEEVAPPKEPPHKKDKTPTETRLPTKKMVPQKAEPSLKVMTKGVVTTADKATIRYVRRGQGSASQTVIVLEQGYIVLPLFRYLEAITDVVYMWGGAIPGKGSKPRTPGQVDSTTIEDVEALRKHLKVKDIILVGNSHRGLISLEYARKYPQYIKMVVAVDPLIHHPGHITESFRHILTHLKGKKGRAARGERQYLTRGAKKKRFHLIDFFRSFEARTLYNKHHNILAYYDFIGRLREVMPRYRFSVRGGHYVKPVARIRAMVQIGFRKENLINYSILGAAKSIQSKVCLIQGEKDPLTTVTWAKALHKNLPASSLHIIPEAGHNPSFENPQAFNKALESCTGLTLPKRGVKRLLPARWQPRLFKTTHDKKELEKRLRAHYEMAMRPRGMVSQACQFARKEKNNRKLLKSLGVNTKMVRRFLKETCGRFPPPNTK